MTFFWNTNVGDFFFDGLKVNSVASLLAACAVTAIASVLYEAIKVILELIFRGKHFLMPQFSQIHSASVRARTAREQIAAVSCAQSESANFLITDRVRNGRSFPDKCCQLFSEACIYFCHSSLSYAIMLSVMLYSGWLFVASIVGMGLGYFMFGHISMKINMENVQARTTNVICSPACPESGSIGGKATKEPRNSFLSQLLTFLWLHRQ